MSKVTELRSNGEGVRGIGELGFKSDLLVFQGVRVEGESTRAEPPGQGEESGGLENERPERKGKRGCRRAQR